MELSHRSRPRRASARCCRPTRASTRMRRRRERSAACRGACVRAAASCFGATSARPHRCEKSCLTELQLRHLDGALLHVWRKYSCMFCNNSACIDSTALLTSYTPTVVHPTHSSGTFARLRACISLLSLFLATSRPYSGACGHEEAARAAARASVRDPLPSPPPPRRTAPCS